MFHLFKSEKGLRDENGKEVWSLVCIIANRDDIGTIIVGLQKLYPPREYDLQWCPEDKTHIFDY